MGIRLLERSIGEQPVIPTTRGGHLNGQISRADQGDVSGPATPSVSFHWLAFRPLEPRIGGTRRGEA
jgi:hypothetical protein